MNARNSKQSDMRKIVMIFLVIALVVVGGVAAYAFLNQSAKEQYFLAESKSMELLSEKVEGRYQSELDWSETTEQSPTKSDYELSVEYNDPGNQGVGIFSAAQIINNAKVNITSEVDKKNEKFATTLGASFANMDIGNLDLYLTGDELLFGLPFVEDVFKISNADLNKLLGEADPTMEDVNFINFKDYFRSADKVVRENLDHLLKNYMEVIYHKLPDEAFEMSSDQVEVNKESLKTDKITFKLSEKETKDILLEILNLMEKDEKLNEYMDLVFKQMLASPEYQHVFSGISYNLKDMIAEVKDNLDLLQIPEGITSTIWVHKGLVVKRDLSLSLAENNTSLLSLHVKGTQLLDKDKQVFQYEFNIGDEETKATFGINGDLFYDGKKSDDTITLLINDNEVIFTNDETFDGKKKEFKRHFEVPGQLKFMWNGDATYEKSNMKSNHQFAVEADEISGDMLTVHLKKTAETTKEVKIPSEGQVKDLGNMNLDELADFFENEVLYDMQEYLFNLMGPSW